MKPKKEREPKWMWAYFDKDTPFWAPVFGGGRTEMLITKGTLCKIKEIRKR